MWPSYFRFSQVSCSGLPILPSFFFLPGFWGLQANHLARPCVGRNGLCCAVRGVGAGIAGQRRCQEPPFHYCCGGKRLGIRPTTTRLQLRVSAVRFAPLVLGWRLLHFFIVNELLWKSITFSGAVTLLAKRDVNSTATRSAAPLLFTTWPTWLHTALS
jgi:hypothetical protein